jgi:hypothetical protein
MAGADRRQDEIRRRIEAERVELARAVDALRAEVGRALDIESKLRAKLPVVAAATAGAGFVLGGGIGATLRYFARRGREHPLDEQARAGRFALVKRD